MTDKREDQNIGHTHQGAEPGRVGGRQDAGSSDKHSSRTAGTNRDFDEKQESANQGHGHPREERSDQR